MQGKIFPDKTLDFNVLHLAFNTFYLHYKAIVGIRASARFLHNVSLSNIIPETNAGGIKHLLVPESSLLSAYIWREMPELDIYTLMQDGCVYRKSSVINSGKAMRIMHDTLLLPGDYLRIHTNPRRYTNQLSAINWDDHIIYDDIDFVVLNKPAGIPTVPTVDNFYENVVVAVAKHMKIPRFFPPQRLDTDTSGLLILGKTTEFAAFFSHMIRKRLVKKTYRVLIGGVNISDEDLKVDESVVHYTGIAKENMRNFSAEEGPETRRCELKIIARSDTVEASYEDWMTNILDYQKSSASNKILDSLDAYFGMPGGPHSPLLSFTELEVELITGRTHQIRGQLQELGSRPGKSFHIAGDNRYIGPTTSAVHGNRNKSNPFLGLQVSFQM